MENTRVHTLSNGCKVILRPTPDKQILSIVATLRWGARDDAPDRAGEHTHHPNGAGNTHASPAEVPNDA